MKYTPIRPPFNKRFRDMSKPEIKVYFEWFVNVVPERVAELLNLVRQTGGYEDWEADCSPGSLERLGNWLAAEIRTRKRSEREIAELAESVEYPVHIEGEMLDQRSILIAVDVGIYFGEMMMRSHPSLKWATKVGSKKYIDYGQPLIVGFGFYGDLALNPVGVGLGFAQRLSRNNAAPNWLLEFFCRWSKQVYRSPSTSE